MLNYVYSSKANHIATACAVGAYISRQPVRIVLDLETNMRMIGKRLPYLTKYEVRLLIIILAQLFLARLHGALVLRHTGSC